MQVVADQPGAGKTSLVGALLSHLAAQGWRAGYYKPFSQYPESDPDVPFVSHRLLAGVDLPQVPMPNPAPQGDGPYPLISGPLAGEIAMASAALEAATPMTLVEGPDLSSPSRQRWSLPVEVANLINSQVVLLFGYAKNLQIDMVLGDLAPFSDRLAGVVINAAPPYRWQEIQDGLMAELQSRGLPIMGVLPEDRTMLGVTVQQIADHLGGRWVQDPVNTDASVDRFLIGGNIMDSGPTYFGRYAHQAVITRAERPDIQMASLMAETQCLVLTGGREPTEYVKAEALQRDVPLLLVEESTLATADALGGLLDQAKPHSIEKIDRFATLVWQHLDLDRLTSALS